MPDTSPGASKPDDELGARTPWSAGAATVFGVIAVALSVLIAGFAQPLHAGLGDWIARGRGAPGENPGLVANTMITLIMMQAVMTAMAWWGAGRFGGERIRLLSLDRGLSLTPFLWGLGGMILLLGPYNLLVYTLLPQQFATDLRPMWDLARSPVNWLVGLAVIIGAPVAEELLFRGFLLPALTKTSRGFWGAAVATTFGWTALHFYSIAGLIEVFAIGIYFAWLVRRYGTLWLPMALHALYNGLQFAVLASWPG
jgi:membrane protease YdiL (CAAX protease family)